VSGSDNSFVASANKETTLAVLDSAGGFVNLVTTDDNGKKTY